MFKFIKGIFVILFFSVILIFLYCNMGENGPLNYPVHFSFNVPPFLYLTSKTIPLGFLIIATFSLGMLLATIMGFFQFIAGKFELRAKNKCIKKLEKKLYELENKYPPLEHFPKPVPPPALAEAPKEKIKSRREAPAPVMEEKEAEEEVADAEFDEVERSTLFEDFRRDFK